MCIPYMITAAGPTSPKLKREALVLRGAVLSVYENIDYRHFLSTPSIRKMREINIFIFWESNVQRFVITH